MLFSSILWWGVLYALPDTGKQKLRGGLSLRQSLTFANAAFAIVLLVAGGCRASEKKPEERVVRMATILGRIMNPLANELSKVLPEHFPARVEVQTISSSGEYPRLIETGQIDLAMIQTDLAYAAYTQGLGDSPSPMRKLRGVAVLYTTPLHLLVTDASHIRSVMDLRGKRVYAGATASSTTEFTTRMSLQALGLSLSEMQLVRLPDTELVSGLRAGLLDAVFYRGNDPYPLIQEMMQVPGVSLLAITPNQIETIRAYHPFFHATSVPAGTYGTHPEIETVGGDMLLASRADLPDELVYWVTRTLFESLPELSNSLPALRRMDTEHVQASPIPLHGGAARFYREHELFP
jgi:TRAP transporter TAXI family solute receptor